ncbi:glycoside hydrolase family 73 protein [Vagococcus teuberi]|uniref:N-acetylmuramoyl-L-alanine amidase n=1 Tax=Vagococcus teuberi TaxID=519472 RepID=A0A1J0A768_9ENTE|nr:glycoside hydrolase family 73 protein [Vagococcus teuberi]APB31772.1 N-acetylmuramoyl-L-alanine amidase [Vagococcus teuberi]
MAKKYARRKKTRYKLTLPILVGALLLMVSMVVFLLSLRGLTSTTQTIQSEETNTTNKQDFIDEIVPVAKEMQASHGIMPSIILAQAILESDWGTSELSAKYNNLFGIKSFSPNDHSIKLETKEYKDGKWETIKANFKVYASWSDCIRDHTLLFVQGVDWDPYLYQGVLLADDYQTAAKALQVAGYATDPGYADKLVSLIKQYQLDQYDH